MKTESFDMDFCIRKEFIKKDIETLLRFMSDFLKIIHSMNSAILEEEDISGFMPGDYDVSYTLVKEIDRERMIMTHIQILKIVYCNLICSKEFAKNLIDVMDNVAKRSEREHMPKRNNKCQICGGESHVNHHIIPLCIGGINDDSNIMPVCTFCHGFENFEYVVKILNMMQKMRESNTEVVNTSNVKYIVNDQSQG